jgi:Family of unknown function (DUF6295)
MCSYVTKHANVTGSAKGPSGWFRLTDAVVYFDHPYHAPYEHTLNIDFTSAEKGPSERVAVELTPGSARQLVEMINAALEAGGDVAIDIASALGDSPARGGSRPPYGTVESNSL